MADSADYRRPSLLVLPALLSALLLAGCGNTGDLYLPESGTTGEVVTRPSPPPSPEGSSDTSNSPQSVDSPVVPPNPAPEVTAPEVEETTETDDTKDEKKDGAGNPPR
jgi:predicted small lipoprotein YifL